MKKHLLAAAVATAIAAPAMAQNVSVYGVIETGIQSFDNGTTSYNRAIDGAINTSRLGFKGSEDLGGGLKAEFQMEARINPSNGGTGQQNANRMFNRELWAGVSGSFGSVRVGQTDITNAVNTFTNVGVSGNLSDGGSRAAVGADSNNVIRYTSPSIMGFQAEVGYATGTGRESATDSSASDKSSVFVKYEQGNLRAEYGYALVDAATKVAETGHSGFGIRYDFGVARVSYASAKLDTSASADTDYKQSVLSVAVPIGNGMTVHGIYNVAKDLSNDKVKSTAVALTKDFSKRTYASIFYGKQDSVANSEAIADSGGLNLLAGSAAGTDTSTIGFTVGHKF